MMIHSSKAQSGQVLYISHGGGPLPILGDASHREMVEFMQQLPAQLHRPDAIVVISAHWEADVPTVLAASDPGLIYDYSGFPEETYHYRYPASGNPELASRMFHLLEQQDIEARLDRARGFDHGLYIPLMLMYPEADIPCTQISLVHNLDPTTHLALGQALRPLLDENVLVIGSGFSFHNLRAFTWDRDNRTDPNNDPFQDWLVTTCTSPMPMSQRHEQLAHWQDVPHARYCHPREEHLLPLHVCVGLAGEDRLAQKIFDHYILGKRAVAFRW